MPETGRDSSRNRGLPLKMFYSKDALWEEIMVLKSDFDLFPGFHTFYLVGAKSQRTFRGDMDIALNDANALTRGEMISTNPTMIYHRMGSAIPKDVLWTTFVGPIIFHKRLFEMLAAKRLSGWSSYPVIVHSKTGEVFRSYRGLTIKGRCGPIDESKAEVVERDFPGGRFPVRKGMFFDPETWDGSDFFMCSDGSLHKFVSQAARDFFQEAKVKEVSLDRLTEVEQPIW